METKLGNFQETSRQAEMAETFRILIFRLNNHTCVWCGEKKAPWDLALDHIIPRAILGDMIIPENFQTLCRSCNSSKGKKLPDEYPDWVPSGVRNFAENLAMTLVGTTSSREWKSMMDRASLSLPGDAY